MRDEEVLAVIAVYEGAKEIPFPIERGTQVHANAAKGLAASTHRLAGGTRRVHHGRGVPIDPEEADPMAGHDAVSPKGLRHMSVEIDPASTRPARGVGRTAVQRSRKGVGRQCREAVAEKSAGRRGFHKARDFRARLVLPDRKRVGIGVGAGGCPTDRGGIRCPGHVVVHHNIAIECRTTFLAERHIQFEFA